MKSLPQGKLYYAISEVSDLVGVKPHVLRYWETQFKMLRPRKGRGGARMYRKRDVEILFDIKQLLYDQRFTIEGAKRKLLDERVPEKDQMGIPFARLDREEAIRGLRDDLRELLLTRREKIWGASGKAETRVFTRWDSTRSVQSGWVYHALKAACAAAGVEYGRGASGVVLHGLRHTAATRMLTGNVDIPTAAEILGNTVATMLESYAHTTAASRNAAVRELSLPSPISLKKAA